MATHFQTLKEWESFLQDQVRGGDVLLCQLPHGGTPFGHEEMNHLGSLLATVFKSIPFRRAIKSIEKRYPLSFALYLVLQGIYNYRGGEYWPTPGEQLGILGEPYYSSTCGRTFRRILGRHNLPTFSHIDGLVNLVPILAHGGVPNYSLGDYFRLLNRSVRRSRLLLDAETLIEEWAANPDEFFFIDRPVQRFVLYGGPVAEDFITRSISLLLARTEANLDRIGLPDRIINGFKQWQKQNRVWNNPTSCIRLARPSIYLDPYGEGVCIELPPQRFPYDTRHTQIKWQIVDNDTSREIPTERQRTEHGYDFSVQGFVPLSVSANYEVALCNESETIKTWSFTCLDENRLLLFDPATGDLLRRENQWQSGEKWIVYPNDWEINISKGKKYAEFQQQYGSWGKFTMEGWILEPGSTITLLSPDQTAKEFEILEDIALKRPFLTGGNRPLSHAYRSNLPLYVGQPPLLQIPLVQRPDELQLRRWQISVEPEGLAVPGQPRTHSLVALKDWIVCEDNELLVELKSPKLLGERPCGTFEIDVQGPLGRGKKFRVRFVPQLEVNGHETLYLSPDDGEAEFLLSVDRGAHIDAIQSEGIWLEQTGVTNTAKLYCARAAIEKQVAKFTYVSPDNIQVPFHLNVRRLRWALWNRSHQDAFAWTNKALRLFPQALENISETELFIDLPSSLGNQPLYAGWRLVDPQGVVLQERPPDPAKSASQFTILMDELLPECRQAQTEGVTLCLQACIVTGAVDSQTHIVDLLYLTPYLELGETKSDWYFDGKESIQLSLTWQANQPSAYLKMYLWPRDQPWLDDPVILDVPQTNEGFAEWQISIKDIPHLKKYGGEFLGIYQIHDPWLNNETKRPLREPKNAFIFSPTYANKYYQWLVKGFEVKRASLNKVLTLLVYYYRTRNIDQMHHVNRFLSQQAKQKKLNLEQLVFWAAVIRDLDDSTLYKITQLTLFSHELIDQVETTFRGHALLPKYLIHFPTSTLPENVYVRFLKMGLPEVRQNCLKGLCRIGNLDGYEALLNDVQKGEVVVSEATKMLVPSATTAFDYLRNQRSTIAFDILRTLTFAADLDIQWLEPGFVLHSPIGLLQVKQIFDENGEAKDSCHLASSYRVSVFTVNQFETIWGTLKLDDRLVYFDVDHLYQCSVCQSVFENHSKLSKHHDAEHPYESLSFKKIQPPEFKLTELTISSTERILVDEPTSD